MIGCFLCGFAFLQFATMLGVELFCLITLSQQDQVFLDSTPLSFCDFHLTVSLVFFLFSFNFLFPSSSKKMKTFTKMKSRLKNNQNDKRNKTTKVSHDRIHSTAFPFSSFKSFSFSFDRKRRRNQTKRKEITVLLKYKTLFQDEIWLDVFLQTHFSRSNTFPSILYFPNIQSINLCHFLFHSIT